MALPSSGQISLEAIANNNSSSSLSNISLQTESQRFASASIVGDVDGNGTGNLAADRVALRVAPHALSEFYDANFPSSIITGITFTTDGSDTNTVDGEDLDVTFTTNGQAGTYTVRLIDSSGNIDASTTRSGAGTVTFSTLSLTDDTYRPQVEFNTFNVVNDDATFSHHDAIGTITITDPSDTTVANNSVTTAIEHGISITNDNAFNDINWTFAKSSGDGSAPSNISNSSDRSPSVNYTGVGVFTIDCRVDGTPSQARNSSTAAQVTHRIDFTEQITINNPSNQNQGTNYNITGNHKGFSGGIEVDEILASDNSVLSSNDDSTDSRVTSTDFSQQITPSTGGGNSTRSVKAKAHKGSVSATSDAYDIFPLMTTSKNVINPTSQTIFSSTRNTDTSTFPTSFTFSSPSTRTDNVTQGTYTEQADSGNAISLSGDTTPSSQTATQPTVDAGVSAGTGTVRYTVTGSVGQETATDCAVTVNFSKEIFSVSTVAVGGSNDTVNDNLVFSFSNQGFNLLSTRFELMEASDGTTQRGNDFDSTSFTGGGLQATNTENVTLTSQNSSFGYNTGGTFKIKISLFENDAQSGTPIKTALTDSFQTFAVSEFTSTFKGVDNGEGEFIGYASKLLAAENNSSTEGTANRTIAQAISGAKLFAFNLNASSVVARNNDLSTTFNGNVESGQNFYNNDGSVIEINGSDGVIDSVTDATPATLNAVSEISDGTDDVTIRITGNTIVTRVIQVVSSVNINSKSMASFALTEGTGTTQQNSSFSVDKSLKTLFGASLSGGTTFGITVRGVNEAESGSLSSSTNVTTDLATAFTTISVDTVPYFDGAGTVISDVFSISLSNGTGNTTITIDDSTINSDLQTAEISLAISTSDSTPDSFSVLHDTSGNSQTLSIGHTTGNLFFAFKVEDADESLSSSTGDDAFTMSFTNNSVTKNVNGTFRFHGITSGDTASSVTFSNNDVDNSTINFSDEFIVTITGCSADDQVVFTATRTGDNHNDLDDFKLSMNTTNGTDAYNASGVSVGTGAQETAAITTTTSRSLTFTGLSAGTNTFTGMMKVVGDGSHSAPGNQEGVVTVKATYSNTSGNTISNQTVHAFTVTHNVLI